MSLDVLCLRPEADFVRAGALPPSELQVVYRTLDDPDVPALMKQARALVIPAVGPKIPLSMFDDTSVKFVQVTGAGVDRLDVSGLKRLGIAVANVPGGSNTAVAEYAVTTASVLLRRFAWADAEIRDGNYQDFRARMIMDSLAGLEGLTVGVVGFGVIGAAVAHAFHQRGCRILYYDPAPRDAKAAQAISAELVTLDDLLKSSDVVTLHVPWLPATRGLIGGRELALMKSGAVLIQASRGGIVDEDALASSLQSGRLGGAAMDVYASEPPAADHPLLALRGEAARRVLFTPHIAGVTRQATTLLCQAALRNVERVLIKHEAPLDAVSS
jgi:phosphoglycerate dehydrogenase-like enzyme